MKGEDLEFQRDDEPMVNRPEEDDHHLLLRKSLAQAKRGEGRPALDILKEIAATVGIILEK